MSTETIAKIDIKDNIGVWCKCDRIIFATTRTASFSEYENFWDSGLKIGLVSARQVHELYGCACKKKKKSTNAKAAEYLKSLQTP